MSETMDTPSQVDNAVASFTRELLDVARENKVDFAAVKPMRSKSEEVLAVLQENLKVAKRLLGD